MHCGIQPPSPATLSHALRSVYADEIACAVSPAADPALAPAHARFAASPSTATNDITTQPSMMNAAAE
jgi:hypothetical protein